MFSNTCFIRENVHVSSQKKVLRFKTTCFNWKTYSKLRAWLTINVQHNQSWSINVLALHMVLFVFQCFAYNIFTFFVILILGTLGSERTDVPKILQHILSRDFSFLSFSPTPLCLRLFKSPAVYICWSRALSTGEVRENRGSVNIRNCVQSLWTQSCVFCSHQRLTVHTDCLH